MADPTRPTGLWHVADSVESEFRFPMFAGAAVVAGDVLTLSQERSLVALLNDVARLEARAVELRAELDYARSRAEESLAESAQLTLDAEARAETAETALAAARQVVAWHESSTPRGWPEPVSRLRAALLAVPDQPNPTCHTCHGTRKVHREFQRIVARRAIPDWHDAPCPDCVPDQPDPTPRQHEPDSRVGAFGVDNPGRADWLLDVPDQPNPDEPTEDNQ